jgi:rhodanese-related sulfurtransferase
MTTRKGYKDMLAEANALVEALAPADAAALLGRDDVAFIDLRDPRELDREGRIEGAVHCPRGMLEFWIDPESPYHKEIFSSGRHFVFFCAGGWRSALAARTALEMGLETVSHVEGGFSAWKDAGLPHQPGKPKA